MHPELSTRLAPAPYGFGKCALRRPARSKTETKSALPNTDYIGPFRQCFGGSVVANKRVRPGVPVLLPLGRPATVGFRVVTIVVDPVKGGSIGADSHVGKEMLEASPSRAHGNATAAVVGEVRLLRIFASLEHRQPRAIGRRAGHAVCPVAKRKRTTTAMASARRGSAAPQVLRRDPCFRAASALGESNSGRDFAYYGPPPIGNSGRHRYVSHA